MAEAGVIGPRLDGARRGLSRVAVIRVVTLVLLLLAYQAVSGSGLVFQGAMPSLVAISAALVSTILDPGF